jgi:uncharacterized membrane protein (UPF0127 family)
MKTFLGPLVDDARGFSLTNERTGGIVAWDLATAFDSASRRTGLLRHTSLGEGTALIIAPSNAVHTFFMRFPIDLAFVARDGRIVKVRDAVGPWRMSAAFRGFAVIELAAGRLRRTETVKGDRLIVTASKPDEAALSAAQTTRR